MNNPVNKSQYFALIAKEEQSNPYVPFGKKRRLLELTRKSLVAKRFV